MSNPFNKKGKVRKISKPSKPTIKTRTKGAKDVYDSDGNLNIFSPYGVGGDRAGGK